MRNNRGQANEHDEGWGARSKRLLSSRCCALHQEIPEDKLSRVAAYDWFGSVALVPPATALASPAQTAFGRTSALWGCAALVVVVTAAVLCVPDVRNLRRRTKHVSASERVGSADAESAVGGLG